MLRNQVMRMDLLWGVEDRELAARRDMRQLADDEDQEVIKANFIGTQALHYRTCLPDVLALRPMGIVLGEVWRGRCAVNRKHLRAWRRIDCALGHDFIVVRQLMSSFVYAAMQRCPIQQKPMQIIDAGPLPPLQLHWLDCL